MSTFFDHSDLATVQGITSTTWFMALIAVVSRFTARRMSKAGLWYDDYVIILALIGGLGLWLNYVIWMSTTAQDPSDDISGFIGIMKCEYITNIMWTIAVSSTKFSILLLYMRLFSQLRKSRWIIRILFCIVICWAAFGIVRQIFPCQPISAYWDDFAPEEACPLLRHSHGQYTITHVVIDILILAAPIPMMWDLELRVEQKLMLCGVLGLGGFVTIVSGLRLKYTLVDVGSDTLGSFMTKGAVWSCVEVNTGIICACLPCLRPLASYTNDKLKALRQRKRPVRQGAELLVDMLPRRGQKQKDTSKLLHETPEIYTTHKQIDVEPQEIATTQRLLPEMAAVERGPFELASLDLGPINLASDMV